MFNTEDCTFSIKGEVLVEGRSQLFVVTDIALHPNGLVYVTSQKKLYTIDLSNGLIQSVGNQIDTFPERRGISSLTISPSGIIFGLGLDLTSYDPHNQVYKFHGSLPSGSIGGVIWYKGNLIYQGADNFFYKVNIENPILSERLFEVPGIDLGSLTLINYDCDSTLVIGVDLSKQFFSNLFKVYQVDIETGTYQQLCELEGFSVWGFASPTELYPVENCELLLDLDWDNSSGRYPFDFQAPELCRSDTLPLADTDARINADQQLDSLVLRLVAAPDGSAEYLSGDPTPGIQIVQRPGGLLLLPITDTLTSDSWSAALRRLQYINSAPSPTPGPRAVDLILYDVAGDTAAARAYLRLQNPSLSAGADAATAFCSSWSPGNLFSELGNGASPGGIWQPDTRRGGGLFDPAQDTAGIYRYIVSEPGCPSDTANVQVDMLQAPYAFTYLSQSSHPCSDSLLLAPLTGERTFFLWDDGSADSLRYVSAPGDYSVTMTGESGCSFQQTFQVADWPRQASRLDTVRLCSGEAVPGYNFAASTDTLLFRTAPTGFGCDSSIYLQVLMHPTERQLETVITCSADTLIQGILFTKDTLLCRTTLSSTGCPLEECLQLRFLQPDTVFQDTLLCSGTVFGGPDGHSYTFSTDTLLCFTPARQSCSDKLCFRISFAEPIIQQDSFDLCRGETLFWQGQEIAAPGAYTHTAPAATGCDTLFRLKVDWIQPDTSYSEVVLCSGDSLLWNGQILNQAGFYYQTLNAAGGCDSVATIRIREANTRAVKITGDSILCEGAAGRLSVLQDVPLRWSTGDTTSTISIDAPGQYIVTETTCGSSDSLEVELIQSPVLAGLDTSVAAGTPLTLQPLSEDSLLHGWIRWDPPGIADCDTCPVAQLIAQTPLDLRALWESPAGCSANTVFRIRITAPQAPAVYIPTAFSPNGDDLHETFGLWSQDAARIRLLQIFDRWGTMVFEVRDLAYVPGAPNWDGRKEGKALPQAVYVFRLELEYTDGSVLQTTGELTLVR